MRQATFAPVENIDRERTWTPAQERWQEQRRLTEICAAAYRAVKDLPVAGAFNPDVQSRSPRWTPDSAHYAIDIENTVRRVIESKPEPERPDLWRAWESLLTDDAKISKASEKLIKALAPKFYRNELHPSLYFRPNKHPQRNSK